MRTRITVAPPFQEPNKQASKQTLNQSVSSPISDCNAGRLPRSRVTAATAAHSSTFQPFQKATGADPDGPTLLGPITVPYRVPAGSPSDARHPLTRARSPSPPTLSLTVTQRLFCSPPRRALTCSMTLLNNTSKLSAQKDEPSHMLSPPEDMCNLWPSNKLEEEVGGEPLFLFSMSVASHHDFNAWPINVSKARGIWGFKWPPNLPLPRRERS